MQGQPCDKYEPAVDDNTADKYGDYRQNDYFNDDFLDRAFFPDPIFDDPNIRAMFDDATLSGGMFWHNESNRVVEGVAEIPPRITRVLNRAVSVGLL